MHFFQHDVGEVEAYAVAQCIRDGHLTTGVKLREFQDALIEKFSLPNVALCNSGTTAIWLTLQALGIGPGDEVITTPYVGVWTVNPILQVGATPVFADIDQTYNLSLPSVASKLTSRTKAVMPVAVNGNPIHVDEYRAMLPPHVRLICDDIEALGSTKKGVYVGQDIGNDVSIGGFWVSKQVTTCSGGMVVSGDEDLVNKVRRLTRHGHGVIGDMWDQNFGYNVSMTDPMCAMGIVQLSRFKEKQDRLELVEMALDCHFKRPQKIRPGDKPTKFVYMIELPPWVDKKVYSQKMAVKEVPTRPYFNSLLEVPHLQQYASPCPEATRISKSTVALPFHWKLTAEEIRQIVDAHEASIV